MFWFLKIRKKSKVLFLSALLLLTVFVSGCSTSGSKDYFAIKVIDADTQRGVPLVELKTVNNIRYYTDSGGYIAFHEPGLMDRKVYFHVKSHGYHRNADMFGYRGTSLLTTPGKTATVTIKRDNIAERLYRITGQGVYRDTILLGLKPPIKEGLLNGRVLGQDTVMATVYKDKVYWFWGDTDRESFPLGHFAVSGATSELPGKCGLEPDVGVDLTYFVDNRGFSKKMLPLGGEGMLWIEALMVLKDKQGNERLLTHYERMASLDERTEHGLAVFNDEKEVFEKLVEFPADVKLEPSGHTLTVNIDGEDYFNFAESPYPLIRVKAKWDHVIDTTKYEAFTCLNPGSVYNRQKPELDYKDNGDLNWDWKKDTAVVNVREHRELIEDGKMKPEQAWLSLKDVETGEEIFAQGGSVFWNDYLKRWIAIIGQVEGSSNLGELWFSQARSPHGPWRWARKIVTHDRYSFYNPTQHKFFDRQEGRVIYFEGTYTASFSGAKFSTPRYNYNQIMYKLDLSDGRLQLPE